MLIILKEVEAFLYIAHPESAVDLLSPDIVEVDIESDAFNQRPLLLGLGADVVVHESENTSLSVIRMHID